MGSGRVTSEQALSRLSRLSTSRDGIFTAETVMTRLEEAGTTLLSLPNKGCLPGGVGAAWPDIVRRVFHDEPVDREMSVPLPPAAMITRMDEAFRWISLIPLDAPAAGSVEPWSRSGGAIRREIVWKRALVSPRTQRHIWSWRRLAEHVHASHEAVRHWHAHAIDRIVSELRRYPGGPKK